MSGTSDSPSPPPPPPPPPQPPPPPPPPPPITGGGSTGKIQEKAMRKGKMKGTSIGDSTPPLSSHRFKLKLTEETAEGLIEDSLPCSVCGKTFVSWNALFGHMRCHPERQWRGVYPPPNFRQPPVSRVDYASPPDGCFDDMTEEDREVASCLLLLADCLLAMVNGQLFQFGFEEGSEDAVDSAVMGGSSSRSGGHFECSSCKKVFGSHQALGGHRASHKTVKGCFASTGRSDGSTADETNNNNSVQDPPRYVANSGNRNGENNDRGKAKAEEEGTVGAWKPVYQCEVCKKVFMNSQALGGHRRTHQPKRNQQNPQSGAGCSSSSSRRVVLDLDLNLPAPVEETAESSSSSSSSDNGLNLKLGF